MKYINRVIILLIASLLLISSLAFNTSDSKRKIFLDFYNGMTEKEYYEAEKKLIGQWKLSTNGKGTYYIYQDKNDNITAYGFLKPVFDAGKLIGIALFINDENNTGRIGDCYPLYNFKNIQGLKNLFTAKYGKFKYRENSSDGKAISKQFSWNNIVLDYYSFYDIYKREIFCCTVYYC